MVEETVHKTLVENNWDYYRRKYVKGMYSFDDLVRLNNIWYHKIQDQEFYKLDDALEFFSMLNGSVSVVELGCYRGSLAQHVLAANKNITSWLGYDICSAALDETVATDKRFTPVYMDEQWCTQHEGEFDVFVSTHTLEHMTASEVRAVLNKLSVWCRQAVYLELPLVEHGKVWRGGASSHVLRWGRKHFRDLFNEDGWEVIYEPPAANTVMTGWTMGAKRNND